MNRLAKTPVLILLWLIVPFLPIQVAKAQEVHHALQPVRVEVADGHTDRDQVVHRTPELMRSPEGRSALAELHRLRKQGVLGKSRTGTLTAPSPGTERVFWVLDLTTCSGPAGCQYMSETFTLVVSESRFNIWVANTDLATNGGKLVASDWDEFSQALGSSTPAASWNPSMGIIDINETVFGPPSDIDGNGRLDVLVHDIKDQYDPQNGVGLFTAGYFSPADLTNGNNADIIHLDTYPSIYDANGNRRSSDFILQTLAHEYQHLIFAVQHGSFDLTFIDEGLAEWAEVVNGYTPRTISYLSSAEEMARPLLDWREDPNAPYGGPMSEDYQRGGLFHHYLAERVGTEAVGAISRGRGNGVGNYVVMLNDLGASPDQLRLLVTGFHAANLVNDQTLNPAYGYASPFRSGIRASGFESVDGSAASSSRTTGNLSPGSVRYVRWSQVGSFTIDITSTSGAQHITPLLLLKSSQGTLQEAFPDVGGEPLSVAGDFEEVYLVLPHSDLSSSAVASFMVNAAWGGYSGNTQVEQVVYDTGEAAQQDGSLLGYGLGGGLSVSLPSETQFANVFDIPVGAALASVDVAMLFYQYLGGITTTSTVRDFTLTIYGDQEGEPGEVILSRDVQWTAGITSPELTYQTVDLDADAAVLSNHQGRIYVSISDAGSDDNHIFLPLAVADHDGPQSPSFMYYNFSNTGLGWASFDNVQDGSGGSIFEGYVVPIRATINLVGGATDTESDDALPQTLTLAQNYPNPFNPNTTISFHLSGTTDVQLKVFDLLGRRVATLVDGMLPPGAHEVDFNASNLTSGIYLYTITAGSQRMARTMTLLK